VAEPVKLVAYDPDWVDRFQREKVRIVNALGPSARGGMALSVQHVGSTSIPGLLAKPCVDILVAARPSPLPGHGIAALELLGYDYRGENGIPGRQYFQKGPHDFHVHVVSGDSGFLADHLLFRDYLRAKPAAASAYGEAKLALAREFEHDRKRYLEGKEAPIARLLEEARKWYREELGFEPLRKAVLELEGVNVFWMVASGWAIDLYLQRVSRVHHDVDISVFRDDQLALHAFLRGRGWEFVCPDGDRLEPWVPGVRLDLPRHQVLGYKGDGFLEVLFSERRGRTWFYRREPSIELRLERISLISEGGVRYLAPEVVLLFKSAHSGEDSRARDKDQADFESVLEHGLEPERREWLRRALQSYRPGHPWLGRL
jgi:GrpB-like predicted nucleotidyltransferase (UPF0157 family)